MNINEERLHGVFFDKNERGNMELNISIKLEVIGFPNGGAQLCREYIVNGSKTFGCPILYTMDELLSTLRIDKMIADKLNAPREWSEIAKKAEQELL